MCLQRSFLNNLATTVAVGGRKSRALVRGFACGSPGRAQHRTVRQVECHACGCVHFVYPKTESLRMLRAAREAQRRRVLGVTLVPPGTKHCTRSFMDKTRRRGLAAHSRRTSASKREG